jgi:hypothetical protein
MEKQIYNYDFTQTGSYDPFKLCCAEYTKIREFWKNEDKNDYPFAEYTTELIDELKLIVEKKDEMIAAARGSMIIRELSEVHFKKKIDLDYILNFCPSGERILMLHRYGDRLTDKEYWKQLKGSYTSQDYNSVPYVFLENMFKSDRNHRKHLMNNREQKLLNSLPEKVNVYRAMSVEEAEGGKYRLSWTLDLEIAEKFVDRNEMIYGTDMTIRKMEIAKKDIIAVFLDRKEQEVIYIQ